MLPDMALIVVAHYTAVTSAPLRPPLIFNFFFQTAPFIPHSPSPQNIVSIASFSAASSASSPRTARPFPSPPAFFIKLLSFGPGAGLRSAGGGGRRGFQFDVVNTLTDAFLNFHEKLSDYWLNLHGMAARRPPRLDLAPPRHAAGHCCCCEGGARGKETGKKKRGNGRQQPSGVAARRALSH